MVSARRHKIDNVVLLLILFVGTIAVINARAIGDAWHRALYKPPDAVMQLAQASGMNQYGEKLFYRFSPIVTTKRAVTAACGPKLGCTSGNTIYVRRGDSVATYNSSVVTAAHEMLHVAYSRFSASEQRKVDELITTELSGRKHPNTDNEIAIYKNSPGDYLNEAHSYLGSEEADLSPALEAYFSQYFSRRNKVVNAYILSPEYQL